MIIGLIGFGKVSQNLVNLIKSENIRFTTSKENRSESTSKAIDNCGIDVLPTFKDVAISSDILISATSPKSSVEVAVNYGKYSNSLYLDLNNISPETTFEINNHVKDMVDGAIIGKIDSDNPTLYLSGKSANKLSFLNDFFNVRIISENIGDVARLKLLRSCYTKTLSAILIEGYEIAQEYNMENEFFEIISLSEGDDFRDKSLSRINNTLKSSNRKSEELNEVIDCFSEHDLVMVKAALDKFNRL